MRKILALAAVVVSAFISNSCKNDLEAVAPYEESVVIYGLLDQNDTANYIRVNKVFVTPGNANQVAQIQDSVYFKPGELSVKIEKYWNGTKRQTYVLSETYEIPLQPGTFNTDQLIYKTTDPFSSDSLNRFFEYKLIVVNNKSGKEYTATTKLVKNVSATNSSSMCSASLGQNCFFNTSNVSILPVVNGKTQVKFLTPINAAICEGNITMYYTNMFLDNSSANANAQYSLGSSVPGSASGGQLIDFSFSGISFFTALANNVTAQSNLKQRVADSLSFTFYFGGEELKLYREINNVSGSFGQEKPIYTNISNGGIGVFSSRTKLTVIKRFYDCTAGPNQTEIITSQTLNYLVASTITCHLLFNGPSCPQNTGC